MIIAPDWITCGWWLEIDLKNLSTLAPIESIRCSRTSSYRRSNGLLATYLYQTLKGASLANCLPNCFNCSELFTKHGLLTMLSQCKVYTRYTLYTMLSIWQTIKKFFQFGFSDFKFDCFGFVEQACRLFNSVN